MKDQTVNARAIMLGALIIGASLFGVACGKPDADVEILRFEMPAEPDAAPPQEPGYVWAALTASVCSNVSADDGVAVGAGNWALEMPDESRIPPAMDDGSVFMLSQDECTSIQILFSVPAGTRPDAVVFSGSSDSQRFSLD
jgi:hypothetical protein